MTATEVSTAIPRRPVGRRIGRVLLAVATLVVAVIGWAVVDLVTSPNLAGGPGDTDPAGRSALGALVRDEGLTVVETDRYGQVRTLGVEQATVVITDPRFLTQRSWAALLALRPARVVLVSPASSVLDTVGLPVRAEPSPPGQPPATPGCDDPAANRAGAIRPPERALGYTSAQARTACYPTGTGAHLYLVVMVDQTEVVLTPAVGTNRQLATEGNAALAMQTVGTRPTVVWWFPRENDPTLPGASGGQPTGNGLPYPSLLPPGWIHAVGLSVIAVVVLAVWRGRRLGPVLTEDLPSVVPASETVEGHGRLYGRLDARDTAAQHLRTAAIGRLSRLLGHADDPEVLAHALADRTGWSYGEIRHLIDGPPPPNDEHLVILKRKLDALEQEARRP